MIWSDSLEVYGEGVKAPVGGLLDSELLTQFKVYKRQIAKRYRVIEPNRIERYLPQGNVWISPKLDGELWFLVKRSNQIALCAHNGRVLKDIPYLKEVEPKLSSLPDFLIAGELIANIDSIDDRPRSHHVAMAFGNDQYAADLKFYPFDVIKSGEEECLTKLYSERIEILKAWFGEDGIIPTIEGDVSDVVSKYQEWVATGSNEGLVVRNEQNITYKIKPSITLDLVVIAYGARLVGSVRQLRELSVALMRDDGSYQLLGTVGNGFTDEDRISWLAKLEPLETHSTFRMANSEGTLSRFIKPELVIECRCSDLLITDTDDRQVRRMALNYDAEKGYSPIGEMPTGVMLHPIFLRLRDDKNIDVGDIGLTQVTRKEPIAEEDSKSSTTEIISESTKGEIVDRKVWVKTTKGKLSVRKYVLIDTKRMSEGYPKFVLFSTDYSAGRAEPLKTTLRTANTQNKADEQIEAWIASNIKKGWNLVDN